MLNGLLNYSSEVAEPNQLINSVLMNIYRAQDMV